MTIRQTARGIGLRALALVAVLVVVGIWIASIALDAIGAVVKLAVWVVVGIVVFVAGAIAVHRMRR